MITPHAGPEIPEIATHYQILNANTHIPAPFQEHVGEQFSHLLGIESALPTSDQSTFREGLVGRQFTIDLGDEFFGGDVRAIDVLREPVREQLVVHLDNPWHIGLGYEAACAAPTENSWHVDFALNGLSNILGGFYDPNGSWSLLLRRGLTVITFGDRPSPLAQS